MRMGGVKGVSAVIKRLRKAGKDKQAALERGLVKAGKFLQRESQKIVPVDTGALKNSAFTRKRWAGTKRVDVLVGYTMSYAIYVHENPHATHKKGKTWKFLEIPLRKFKGKLREIIETELKKKRGK